MQPFEQYAPLPVHGQNDGEFMGGFQTFTGSHGQQGFGQNHALHPMMNQFIQDRGPWTPLNVEKRQPAGQRFPVFTDFRSPRPPPSEADTVSQSVGGIRSDSGYGSMARQSVGNPSLYGDLDQTAETQSLISHFQAMGQDAVSSNEGTRKRETQGQRPMLGTSSVKSIVCPDCHTMLKTKSELK